MWPSGSVETTIGKGKICNGQALSSTLNNLGISPDFEYTKKAEDTRLLFVHRKIDGTEIYWVNNRNNRVEDLEAAFRVNDKAAEVWHPETGKIESSSYQATGEITKVPLHLEPNDAVFVVFRGSGKKSVTVEKPAENVLATVEGPWDVTFQANRGAPAGAQFESLTPWNESQDTGVKYFSGSGVYNKNIKINEEWLKNGAAIWLDLGDVKNLAEVIVNGKSAGIIWKTPFRIDITDNVKAGDNQLGIKLTNLWVNRLIGDQQPDVKEKITYTTMPFYRADSKLLPSGLMGPVKIVAIK